MINPLSARIIAYDIAELEKKRVLEVAKNLFKSTILDELQWREITSAYASNLYTPTIFMKVLLFILSLIGMTTILIPLEIIFSDAFSSFGESGIRTLTFLLGGAIILFTDRIMIKQKQHYKSGVIEAGLYSGLGFMAFGMLGFDHNSMMVYPMVGLILSLFAAIRYMDLLGLVLSLIFVGWITFQFSTDGGGILQAIIPFTFMALFGAIYWFSTKLENKLANQIYETQFTILKTLSLLVVYLAGNYFVVRELSIKLLMLELPENADIPFAMLFYFFTVMIPIGYLYWGIRSKSILWIRVSLLVMTLCVLTLKYYFSMGHPVVTITLSGALLITVSLLLFKYLKQIRNGFTAEKLLNDKWGSQNLTAFIASQTLGGHAVSNSSADSTSFNGGKFGGAGAGGEF